MYQYSTVVKLPRSEDKVMLDYISNRIEPWLREIKASKRVLVHKKQVKGGIKFELDEIKFFRDYTEGRISIANKNPDAEVRLLENDSTAFQNSKRFTVNEVVRYESPYQVRGTPYIKPKNKSYT
ncbi:MAG: hypothetical protein WBZ36_01090, partial [Candidatus Nitrosopolaris sp.]